MATILVTGGAGFIGTFVAHELVEMGHHVRLFDLVKGKVAGVSESLTGSILDPYKVGDAVRGCDYVAHLAAALGVARTETKRLECLYINIQGTVNVLEACIKEKVKKVLFSSSSEVYGEQNVYPTSEEAPVNPKSNYAISKLVGEEYLRAYYENYGLNYVVVRFFNIYGIGQITEFVIPKFVRSVMKNEPPLVYGSGQQIRSFCHVRDAAKGAALALVSTKSNSGIFNIGNDLEPISIADLASRVIRLAGKKLSSRFIPMEECDRTQSRDIMKRIPSIEKARAALNYSPRITLDSGLSELITPCDRIPIS